MAFRNASTARKYVAKVFLNMETNERLRKEAAGFYKGFIGSIVAVLLYQIYTNETSVFVIVASCLMAAYPSYFLLTKKVDPIACALLKTSTDE